MTFNSQELNIEKALGVSPHNLLFLFFNFRTRNDVKEEENVHKTTQSASRLSSSLFFRSRSLPHHFIRSNHSPSLKSQRDQLINVRSFRCGKLNRPALVLKLETKKSRFEWAGMWITPLGGFAGSGIVVSRSGIFNCLRISANSCCGVNAIEREWRCRSRKWWTFFASFGFNPSLKT